MGCKEACKTCLNKPLNILAVITAVLALVAGMGSIFVPSLLYDPAVAPAPAATPAPAAGPGNSSAAPSPSSSTTRRLLFPQFRDLSNSPSSSTSSNSSKPSCPSCECPDTSYTSRGSDYKLVIQLFTINLGIVVLFFSFLLIMGELTSCCCETCVENNLGIVNNNGGRAFISVLSCVFLVTMGIFFNSPVGVVGPHSELTAILLFVVAGLQGLMALLYLLRIACGVSHNGEDGGYSSHNMY